MPFHAFFNHCMNPVTPVAGQFSVHAGSGRKNEARDQAPEASADLSIF
jgi:hypothetical protein